MIQPSNPYTFSNILLSLGILAIPAFFIICFVVAVWKVLNKAFKTLDYMASKEDDRQKKLKEEKKK